MNIGELKVDMGADEIQDGVHCVIIYPKDTKLDYQITLQYTGNPDKLFEIANEIVDRINSFI